MRECRRKSSSLCLSMGVIRKALSRSMKDLKRMANKRGHRNIMVIHIRILKRAQSYLIFVLYSLAVRNDWKTPRPASGELISIV
jgi:hypothetical protein